eukprot:386257-Pelagomonas_calceolata.AAC.1
MARLVEGMGSVNSPTHTQEDWVCNETVALGHKDQAKTGSLNWYPTCTITFSHSHQASGRLGGAYAIYSLWRHFCTQTNLCHRCGPGSISGGFEPGTSCLTHYQMQRDGCARP